MSSQAKDTQNHVELRNPALAAFLEWLLPGLGHWYQGRKFKAIVFGSCVIGLYLTGIWVGRGMVVYWTWVNPMKDSENFRLSFVFQSFVGGFTMPGMFQGLLSYLGKEPLLSGWMAAPAQEVVNGLHPKIGKMVEIGTVYTAVAGLLNLLAIMDAYGGPVRYKQQVDQTGEQQGDDSESTQQEKK